jgi:hypothetical protein
MGRADLANRSAFITVAELSSRGIALGVTRSALSHAEAGAG